MPTYAFTAAAGRITPEQRHAIVRVVTTIHHEETGAPRFLMQAVFYDLGASARFVGGEPAPEGQIWVRADIRAGRTPAQKDRMLRRIVHDVGAAAAATCEEVTVYIADLPAGNMVEYGRVLPEPGEEAAWMGTLPDDLRRRLERIG